MIAYLIKSGGCLLTLLTVYHLLLEKEKLLRFNRAWLLFSLLFSFTIPLLPLPLDLFTTSKIPGLLHFPLPTTVESPGIAPFVNNSTHATRMYDDWIVILYGIVSAFLFLRFVRNLYLIQHRISSHPQVPLEGSRLILLPENYIPHTFGTHVHQRHTLDILFLEGP
jgi:hypothetical protein